MTHLFSECDRIRRSPSFYRDLLRSGDTAFVDRTKVRQAKPAKARLKLSYNEGADYSHCALRDYSLAGKSVTGRRSARAHFVYFLVRRFLWFLHDRFIILQPCTPGRVFSPSGDTGMTVMLFHLVFVVFYHRAPEQAASSPPAIEDNTVLEGLITGRYDQAIVLA